MTTPPSGDLPDHLLSDPMFQAESPQREVIETLQSLTENWLYYCPTSHAQKIALGVLQDSNAVHVVEQGAERKPHARLTTTGLRWKELLDQVEDADRSNVVYMILKLAYKSRQGPESDLVVEEPPELIVLRQWLSIDGVKEFWQATVAAAEYWQLEVDELHKDIAFLLRKVIGGDPSEAKIRDYLFESHGLLPSDPITLAKLREILRQAGNSELVLQPKQPICTTDKLEAETKHAAATPSASCSTKQGGKENPSSSPTLDDKLPKKLRKDSPSRVKARSAYEYAMERIPGAQVMTIAELHAAILGDDEVASMVPERPDAFGVYLREAGIKQYKLNG